MAETENSNFEMEADNKLKQGQGLEGEAGKMGSPYYLNFVIPRSMIIFISVVTGISIATLAFHAIPTMVQTKYLMYQKRGNPMRFDHRISSILTSSFGVDQNSLRGRGDYSMPYDIMRLEFLKKGISEHVQKFTSQRRLSEADVNETVSSEHAQQDGQLPPSPLSGRLTLYSPTTGPELNNTETKSDSAYYTCHRIVSAVQGSGFPLNRTSGYGQVEEGCKIYLVSAQPIPEDLKNLDLPTINALNHLSEVSQSIKLAAEILEGKPSGEGVLLVMASRMNYEPNWRPSLEKIYGNWEYTTQVSQIMLTPWTISKSFFAGNHYTPALDFGFMILNIPPEGGDENALVRLRHSFDVVKSFVLNLGKILDVAISKILAGPSYSILSENRLTEDLFSNWNYSDDSFSYISSYFNKNQSMLLENYLTSAALDVSRLIERLPLTIVDSLILAKDNIEHRYEEGLAVESRLMDLNETQVVVIPPVERKKIARYDYEEKFRRICVYQAHTEQQSILRSTPSRASMVEYARFHGYSYFLFDGSFYDTIPRSMFTDWSKQGYYMKLFSGLKLLFWDLDKVSNVLGKVINDPNSNVMSEKVYMELLESVVSSDINTEWDRQHDGRLRVTGEISPQGQLGKNGIQITPLGVAANMCDYVVWFDLDAAITNKFLSIERILDSNTPQTTDNSPPQVFKNVYTDVGQLALFTTRDSEWRGRNSLVNSGFLIISRSRHSLQALFHAISLNPVMSQEIVRNGRFWPEQSTLTHAIVNIFNYTYGSPNQTYHFLDTPIQTVSEIMTNLVGTTPILFTAYSNETGKLVHSITASQRVANGFLHIRPDVYGEGPWYPGDLFVHAAGQKSPFRDNVLSGMLYSINMIGFTPDEIDFYKNNCYTSLEFVYKGLDGLIDGLSREFVQFEKVKSSDLDGRIRNFNTVDLTFNFIGRLMAIKTRAKVDMQDISLYSDTASYEKIHFLRCSYLLPMSAKWSIAEAFALGGISMLGIAAISVIFKFAKMNSSQGMFQKGGPISQD